MLCYSYIPTSTIQTHEIITFVMGYKFFGLCDLINTMNSFLFVENQFLWFLLMLVLSYYNLHEGVCIILYSLSLLILPDVRPLPPGHPSNPA